MQKLARYDTKQMPDGQGLPRGYATARLLLQIKHIRCDQNRNRVANV